MSYILDALKKKDSEKTDSVPDLNSQHYVTSELESDLDNGIWLKTGFSILVIFLVAALLFFGYQYYFGVSDQGVLSKEQFTKDQLRKDSNHSHLDEPKVDIVKKDSELLKSTESNVGLIIEEKPILTKEPIVKKLPKKAFKKRIKKITKNEAMKNQGSNIKPIDYRVEVVHSNRFEKDLSTLPKIRYSTHVYSDKQQDRFVMLNGKTYSIGDTTAKGIKVVDILENDLLLKYKNRNYKVPALVDID